MKSLFLGLSLVGAILMVVATIAVADDAKEAAIKKDREQLAGTWRVVAVEENGKDFIKVYGKLFTVDKLFTVINGADGSWSFLEDGREISKGISTIDPTKKPKTIDFTVTDGNGKGNKHKGIYELGEKTRNLLFAQEGKERPTEFSSAPGSGIILVTFEREKAK